MAAKRQRPKLVKFKPATKPDDSGFVDTLIWVLEQARSGKVRGYAMVFVVDSDASPTGQRLIEAAKAFENASDKLEILGGIRRMEANFMAREWPGEQ